MHHSRQQIGMAKLAPAVRQFATADFARWSTHIRCLLSRGRRVLLLRLVHRPSGIIREATRACELACCLSQTAFPNGGSPANTSGARSLRPELFPQPLVLLLQLLNILRERLSCVGTRD